MTEVIINSSDFSGFLTFLFIVVGLIVGIVSLGAWLDNEKGAKCVLFLAVIVLGLGLLGVLGRGLHEESLRNLTSVSQPLQIQELHKGQVIEQVIFDENGEEYNITELFGGNLPSDTQLLVREYESFLPPFFFYYSTIVSIEEPVDN